MLIKLRAAGQTRFVAAYEHYAFHMTKKPVPDLLQFTTG